MELSRGQNELLIGLAVSGFGLNNAFACLKVGQVLVLGGQAELPSCA